jgi:hypothetical protein
MSRYRMSVRMDPELRDFIHELRAEARARGKNPSLNDVLCGIVRFAKTQHRLNSAKLRNLPLEVKNASKGFK